MKRKKWIYRIPPVNQYDILGIESWLADMSEKGLYLKKIGLHFAQFEKGAPKRHCYRLEPMMTEGDMPKQEQLEHYQNAGWNFVTSYRKLFFLFCNNGAGMEEAPTDPVTQGFLFEKLDKKLRFYTITIAFSIFVIAAFVLSNFFLSDFPVLLFITGSNFFILLFLLLSDIFLFLRSVEESRFIHTIKKNLTNGISISHEQNYCKRTNRYWMTNGIQILSSFFVLLFILMQFTYGGRENIEDIEKPLPFLPLEMIEKSENFSYPEHQWEKNGVNMSGNVSLVYGPMAPIQLEVYQQGEYKNLSDQEDFVLPSMNTKYFELTFSFLTKPLMEDLMQRYLDRTEVMTVSECYHESFDKIIITKGEGIQYLFAYQNKTVIFIRYYGYADLKENLDLLAKRIEQYKTER